MFRNKFLSYSLPWLVGLFFFSVQGVFADNLYDQRDRRTSSEVVESGSYQSSVFVNDPSPLMLPEFESKGLYLAHYTADSPAPAPNPATTTSTAKPKAADDASLAAKATNPIANLMQFQLQNSFIPESYHASGYSNAFVIQPVIPIKFSKDGFFPFMITRTTLPILTTPDPEGEVGGTTLLAQIVVEIM